ncbi:Hypp6183 [Branchiostoma lanceolatum]|uniref:Hypp6183 protein n=1 Tax=Branchiostoma lanceolatum TaxID=7740 RepID=A0A8J9VMH0_BRALA|nr:Hypp6183 [Branchiostoma lanceolatum]
MEMVYGKLGRDSLPEFKLWRVGEAAVVRLVRTTCEALGSRRDKKSGCRGDWIAWLPEVKHGKNNKEILDGKVELVFGSPESGIRNKKWRDMLASPRCRENSIGIVVDDAHTRKLMDLYFTREVLSASSLRGLGKHDALDEDIMTAIIYRKTPKE